MHTPAHTHTEVHMPSYTHDHLNRVSIQRSSVLRMKAMSAIVCVCVHMNVRACVCVVGVGGGGANLARSFTDPSARVQALGDAWGRVLPAGGWVSVPTAPSPALGPLRAFAK